RFARLRVQVHGRDANFAWCILLDGSLGNPRLKRERESLSIGFDGGPTIIYKEGCLTPANDEHRT
ncbi:MAG TPA: hypothetical protein VMF59_14210, partial [Bacteroidota bacterium]|nr:hypothetical protein [Bacteroidota bacterium]